jgi:histidine triad (HIT) family protein
MTEPYASDNIFARIIRREIPAHRVYDDANHIVMMDIFPQSRGHMLVIPKAPSRNILDAKPETLSSTIELVQKVAQTAKSVLAADGIRIMQFNESVAGQTVFHLHFHVIPVYAGVETGRHGEGRADDTDLAAIAASIAKAL